MFQYVKELLFLQRSKLFFKLPNFLTIFCLNYSINLHSSCVHIKVLTLLVRILIV